MRAERRRDPTAAQLLHARARAASDRCRFHEFARKNGADGQTRTADRRFTKPLLYRLSYVGADFLLILACSEYQGDGPRDGCVAVRREGVHLRSISTALTSGGACVRCRCPFSWQIALYVAAVCEVPTPLDHERTCAKHSEVVRSDTTDPGPSSAYEVRTTLLGGARSALDAARTTPATPTSVGVSASCRTQDTDPVPPIALQDASSRCTQRCPRRWQQRRSRRPVRRSVRTEGP